MNRSAASFLMMVCIVRFMQRAAYGVYLVLAWQTWNSLFPETSTVNSFLFASSSLVMVTFAFQALCEIPAGIIADNIGRPRAVGLGLLLLVLCYVFYAMLAPTGQSLEFAETSDTAAGIKLPLLVLAELFLAAGLALLSGAIDAWAIDGTIQLSLTIEDAEQITDLVVARLGWVGQCGSLCGGLFVLCTYPLGFHVAVAASVIAAALVLHMMWRDSQPFSIEGATLTKPEDASTYQGLWSSFISAMLIIFNPAGMYSEARKYCGILFSSASVAILWLVMVPSELVGQTAEYLWSAYMQARHITFDTPGDRLTLAAGFGLANLGGVLSGVCVEWAIRNRIRRTTVLMALFLPWLFGLLALIRTNASIVVPAFIVPGLLKFGAEGVFVCAMGRLNVEISRRSLSTHRATLISAIVVVIAGSVSVFSAIQKVVFDGRNQAVDSAIGGFVGSAVIALVIAIFWRQQFDSNSAATGSSQ